MRILRHLVRSFAFIAVLAVLVSALAIISSTGMASAHEQSSNTGFVVMSQDVSSLALPTSNTLADPTVSLASRDPSDLVAVNPVPDVGYGGVQSHKDQVVYGSNVATISAFADPNNATGPAGSLQAVLANTTFTLMFVLISLALAASVRFLGKRRTTFLYGLSRRADLMMAFIGRTTTRAVTSVVRYFGGMSHATTPSALTST